MRFLGGNGDLKFQLAITDEFRVHASAILLERVTIDFLLASQDLDREVARRGEVSCKTLGETEFFIKNIAGALALSGEVEPLRANIAKLICNLITSTTKFTHH